ncbi:alpha-hydroxy-acid oxidizing enzyme [Bacillus canaveralius]|uniref:L-lactate oxidase n=1 Tax=Bacillus canaveralius TaxID=1403243 RepID=A0A2N5GRX7_9BACI|nr:alpha-hydroxy-acid oxidizing protein [Bacillus canaveralius]PLR86302.1 alpha-hydroxy-acid oxidizing enzyme [Bacillus canaveralius]PLR97763.1 alpha-hydroxy-acid oxidizing enzyme [Bacillus canaveralius]
MAVISKEDPLLAKMKETGLNFSVEEWERAAERILEQGSFGYIQSGSSGEETLQKNTRAFEQYSILPRVLTNVANPDFSIELLNQTFPSPLLFAPVGMQRIAHQDGELAAARAAGSFGIPYIASTVSSYTMEEIAEANPFSPNWFQLYWSNDRDLSLSMVKRAENAGYQALVVTVDTVMLGWREKDLHNSYSPLRLGFGKANYISDPVFQAKVNIEDSDEVVDEILNQILHPSFNWDDLQWLKTQTSLPIVLKGILHPDDAVEAVKRGFEGIIVSNHGGRQLDGVASSLDALPLIRNVVPETFPVLFDSGVRRGTDMVKALALGADAVLLGRPYVYGLAVAGEHGVQKVVSNLLDEFKVSAGLAGAKNITEVKKTTLMRYIMDDAKG